jgi:hypothetical protein
MTETTEKPIEKPLPHVHEDVHDPQAKQLITRPYVESDRKPSAMPEVTRYLLDVEYQKARFLTFARGLLQ